MDQHDEILHELSQLRQQVDEMRREQQDLIRVVGADSLRDGEQSLMAWRYETAGLLSHGRSILFAFRLAAIAAAFLVIAKTSGVSAAVMKLLGVSK